MNCAFVERFNKILSYKLYIYSPTRFCTSCICRLWYVVIRVLFDTLSRCKVLGRTLQRLDVSCSKRVTSDQNLPIQLLQNAADNGSMKSDACRAKLKC